MTEVSCHVYRLKVSQDHTNSAVENNIELLPVLPSNYPVPIVDSAALFIINCLALSYIVVPSSFKKSRNTSICVATVFLFRELLERTPIQS